MTCRVRQHSIPQPSKDRIITITVQARTDSIAPVSLLCGILDAVPASTLGDVQEE